MGQSLANRFGGPARVFEFAQGLLDTAAANVASAFVHLLAANVMLVFGQVRQMAEVGEGADHADRLLAGQSG